MLKPEDAEYLAETVSRESGLNDRPRCDPRSIAVNYCGLRLAPWPKARPRLSDGVIWYPANASESAIAYYVGHELAHDVIEHDGIRIPRGPQLEAAASRIGTAVTLPKRAYLRDVNAVGWNIEALAGMWPLASRWVHARRIVDLARDGAVATRWRRGRFERASTDGIAVPKEPSAAERALAERVLKGLTVPCCCDRMRAWPEPGGGAIVLCGLEELARETAANGARDAALLGGDRRGRQRLY